jgi:hypothetical protein
MICIGEPIFLQINRWLDPVFTRLAGQMASEWSNQLLVNRIWLGGSLLWIFTLAMILGELGKAPVVNPIRRILSLH